MKKILIVICLISLHIDIKSDCYRDGYKYNCYKNDRLYYSGTMIAANRENAYDALYFSDGDVLQYLNLTGNGTYYYSSGDKYNGSFIDGDRNGYGIYSWSSGSEYVGYWKDDKRNGQGKWYNDRGNLKYDGQWKDGLEHGYGVKKYYEVFEDVSGNYKNGVWDGIMNISFQADHSLERVESRLTVDTDNKIQYAGVGIFTYKDGSKEERHYSPRGVLAKKEWLITPEEALKQKNRIIAEQEARRKQLAIENEKARIKKNREENIYNQCILDKIPTAKTEAATDLIEKSCLEISKNPTQWQIIKYLGWDGLKELIN